MTNLNEVAGAGAGAGVGEAAANHGVGDEPSTMVWVDKLDGKEYKLSFEHVKLLYIISFYARASKNEEQPETWIREMPLNVLIYETIVAGKLDFDYAPVSKLFSQQIDDLIVSKRQFLNLSQEGLSAIDDLREQHFLNGLKITTADMLTNTALQVTQKGIDLLQAMPPILRLEVEEVLFARTNWKQPLHPKKDLKHVIADSEGFLIVTVNGHEERSGITEVEDVSYVTSPFIPWTLRQGETMMTDNATRAWESGVGASNVKGDLSESIILSQVNVLVGEWCPIAANEFRALLDRFGVRTRYAGGRFTSKMDMDPNSQEFRTRAGLTSVRFLDYKATEAVNFEAEIMFAEAEGIKQVEDLGISVATHGTVFYGIRIEAIGTRLADDISLDLLSRLLVDIQQDSSIILNDLLTDNQRRMLNVTYRNDAGNRNKYLLVFAEKCDPEQKAEFYNDRGEYENELKQVIGDIWGAHDIADKGDVIVIGSHGVLVIGLRLRKFDRIVITFCEVMALQTFITTSFSKLQLLMAEIRKLKQFCAEGNEDPSHFETVRQMRNKIVKDVVVLEEMIGYLEASLEALLIPMVPMEEAGKQLFDVLDVPGRIKLVESQVADMRKLVFGSRQNVNAMSSEIRVLQVGKEQLVALEMKHSSGRMTEIADCEKRSTAIFDLIHMMVAAVFSLIFLDAFITARAKFFGVALVPETSTNETEDGSSTSFVPNFGTATDVDFGNPLSGNASYFPMVWASAMDGTPLFNFIAHLVFMAVCLYALRRLEKMRQGGGIRTVNCKLDKKVNVPRLLKYVARVGGTVVTEKGPQGHVKRCSFIPSGRFSWRGQAPRTVIKIDVDRGFLNWVTFSRPESDTLLRWLLCSVVLRRREHMSMRSSMEEHLLETLLAKFDKAKVFLLEGDDGHDSEEDALPEDEGAEKGQNLERLASDEGEEAALHTQRSQRSGAPSGKSSPAPRSIRFDDGSGSDKGSGRAQSKREGRETPSTVANSETARSDPDNQPSPSAPLLSGRARSSERP